MKKQAFSVSKVLILTVLIIMSIFSLFPFIWMLLTSFKTNIQINTNFTEFFPNPWTLSGYIKAVTEAPFFKWFLNSLVVSVSTTAIIVFTSTLCGFIFAKFDFKGKNLIFPLLLITMMIPSQVMMIPSFVVITKLNLYNSIWSLVIPSMVNVFGIFLTKQFIEDLPDSICEAARLDGAGGFRIYTSIVLPNIKPAIGSLVIFTFLGKWNDYLTPLLYLNDTDRMTLPLALNFFASKNSTDLSATMAAASLIMIPVLVVFVIFQKQFIKGLALSGMK